MSRKRSWNTFGTLHTQALQALADDAKLKFAGTFQTVRSEASRRLSQAEKQKVLGELIASEVEGAANPAKRTKGIFAEIGVTGFRSGNREYGLEYYSSLVTHTVLADAHNTGASARYASNGVQYARRIERPDCCKICQPLKDRIVWLGDSRLLPPTHPWCYGGIAPFIGEPDEDPIMSPDDPRIPDKTRRYLLKKV